MDKSRAFQLRSRSTAAPKGDRRDNSRQGFSCFWRRLLLCVVIFSPFVQAWNCQVAGQEIEEQFHVPDELFDRWVFGRATHEAQERNRLDSLLDLRLQSLQRDCNLTAAQLDKLKLAAHGDIERFFRQVEEKRAQFSKARHNQEQINQFWQQIQPLQKKIKEGLFHRTSLFQKVLERTLGAEQRVRHEEVEARRREYRYQAAIELAVSTFEQNVPLRDDQRTAFIKLLSEETEPPKKIGSQKYHVVMLRAAEIPEQKLKSLFEEFQWKALKQQLDQAKNMRKLLEQNGFVP